MSTDTIGVLYNTCYGGFCLSYQAVTLINRRYADLGKTSITELSDIPRTDPDILEVYRQLGSDNFSGRNSKIAVEYINKKYEHFFKITDYDGIESVIIDYSNSVITEINNILNTQLPDSEKITNIKYTLNNMFSQV
jgi:hypothetical protein